MPFYEIEDWEQAERLLPMQVAPRYVRWDAAIARVERLAAQSPGPFIMLTPLGVAVADACRQMGRG